MRHVSALLTFTVVVLLSSMVFAQDAQEPSVSVPRVITITGVFRPADGQPPAAVETVTLAIYADQQGGAPLWQETQTVIIDDRGRYALLLGGTHRGGIPSDIFGSGEAHWLGTRFERVGEVEGPRIRLTSVPYALRAADADTLGGRPASDYLLAAGTTSDAQTSAAKSDVVSPAAELPGTPNYLAKYVNATDVGPSIVYDTGTSVGIGTQAPLDVLHMQFTNPSGNLTGLAVQNLGNTASSYSGMLFYDQFNQLGQFQGFNNVTHEYRINNIARNPSSQFNGSINFMIGSTSRFFVGANGNIGIGTTAPGANLEVNNGLSATPSATVIAASTGNNNSGSAFVGRKFRTTGGAFAPVQYGDNLAIFTGQGYGANAPGTGGASIAMRAAENWTNTAQGSAIHFMTTANGNATPTERMLLDGSGHLGIGTTVPQADVEVVREADVTVAATAYGTDAVPGFFTLAARGTQTAPAAVQAADILGAFTMGGYGTTRFFELQSGIGSIATENWTDTAHGSAVGLLATPLGALDPVVYVGLRSNGNVGIATPLDVNGVPNAADRLQVFGDIRVGTTGTNGCIKDFSGTGIVGTCSSDRRLKKDITPFGPALNQLTALQPVHYLWRTDDFPDKHFGIGRADGLIAQDVEQVLPELVATDSDGFKAVNYSKLPLFTIQAIKELKAENDALKEQIAELKRHMESDPLKQRVAELERLVGEMLAATSRR